ncbi:MAG TPA: hypothetical protein VMJ70_07010 [Candidatus Sulfotelmatobacter sp.]|nr:hypothetical protein [Candidatus Sulfotelmatobacter sp.]
MLQFEMRQVNLLLTPSNLVHPEQTYTVYRQGATASADAILNYSSTVRVYVYDAGRIVAGNTLLWNHTPQTLFYVIAVDPNRRWLDLQPSDWPITIHAGDRLFPSQAPTLYSDPLGVNALGSNVLTLDSQGRGFFYCPASVYDAVLSRHDDTLYFFDQPAGVNLRSVGEVNVLDYPDFQSAHDALPPTGGRIWVPPGTYTKDTVPAFKGLVVTKPLALLGVANGQASALSILLHDDPDGGNTDSIFLNIAGDCLIKDLFVMRPEGTTGTGRGVRWYKSGDAGRMAGVTLDNVTVWRSPSWAFEFLCDGFDANYVSKLVMVDCTAYESASGGSLRLGGAGSNNNYFNRCEFDGPGEGYYFDVNGCQVTVTQRSVLPPSGGSFTGIAAGDEVFGLGIAVGTTVDSATSSQIMLSTPAIETPLSDGVTTLTFWRHDKPDDSLHPLPRGHVHLVRTSASRFQQCTFQGPGTEPALSTDLVSNYLVLRDSYREAGGTGGTAAHSFVINGMTNLLIDGLYHQFHAYPSLLLRTGPLGLVMGRVANCQLLCTDLTNGNVISLANGTDQVIVDNVFEFHFVTGARRDVSTLSADVTRPAIVTRTGGRVSLPQLQAEISPGTPGPIDATGCTHTGTGTVSRPVTSLASYLDGCERIRVTSAAGIFASASLASGERLVYIGSAAGRGGFYFCARFSADPGGARNNAFIGLANSLSNLLASVYPDALINVIGMACESAVGSYWKIIWNDAFSSVSSYELGSGFPFGGGTYQLELWADPNGAAVNYRVTRLDNESIEPVSGIADSNLPAGDTALAMRAEVNTGDTVATPTSVDVLRLYAELDLG